MRGGKSALLPRKKYECEGFMSEKVEKMKNLPTKILPYMAFMPTLKANAQKPRSQYSRCQPCELNK
jgi:hypothetical protein